MSGQSGNRQTISCRWCRSQINENAVYCKECNQWQSRRRMWFTPGTTLSLIGALAAWSAVIFQIWPKAPEVELIAAQAVEAFEYKAKDGCEKNKTNNCLHEFWALYSAAEVARDNIPNMELRKELRERIEYVMDKHGHKYVELFEWEDF